MSKSGSKPGIIITAGEPAGIGPEIIAQCLASKGLRQKARIFVIGAYRSFAPWAGDLPIGICDGIDEYRPGSINLIPVTEEEETEPGKPSRASGLVAYRSLELAVALLKKHRRFGLVTAPIYKKGIQSAGFAFPGHTEYLGRHFESKPLMTFCGGPLKVATVTTHLALADVPGAITKKRVCDAIATAHKALTELFGISRPVIAIFGLNPHAGEEGRMGNEERKVIGPACDKMRAQGIDLRGPLPADAAFFQAYRGAYDFVIGMYHDQVLAPFKMLYFDTGVNVSLGLPVVRTSPDHGTAFEIAGRGIASPESMMHAIELAIELVKRKEKR